VAYQKDYYAILQVNRNAKQEDIEKAYKRLSTTYDPSTSNKKRAAQRHADVAAAYAVLRDPRRRRQYDRQLASDLASAGSMNPARRRAASISAAQALARVRRCSFPAMAQRPRRSRNYNRGSTLYQPQVVARGTDVNAHTVILRCERSEPRRIMD